MRILFDVSSLFRDGRVESGVPSYTLSLIDIFQKISSRSAERLTRPIHNPPQPSLTLREGEIFEDCFGSTRNDRLEVMFFYSGRKTFGVEHYINEYIHLPIPNKIVQLLTFLGIHTDWLVKKFGRWNSKEVLRQAQDDKIDFDIYFTPNVSTFYRYFSSKIKVVGVVHDVSHVLFPELKPWGERWKYFGQFKTHLVEKFVFWNRNRKSIFKRFDQLVAISEHTKNDLVEFLGIPETKISVIYPTLNFSRHPKLNLGSRKENQKEKAVIASEAWPASPSASDRPSRDWSSQGGRSRSDALNEIVSSKTPRNNNFVSFGFLDSSSPHQNKFGAGQAPPGMTEGKLERFKIQKPYLLFLGHIEPRKNVENLIRAFSILKRDKNDLRLVVAGRMGYQSDKLLRLAKELGLTFSVIASEAWRSRSDARNEIARLDSRPPRLAFGETGQSRQASQSLAMTDCFDIIFTGPVSEEEKYALMKNAEVFVYPSLYEGFAYPCLEALSQGTPVVTSPVSALPEVLGDAALYANPWRPEMIAEVIGEVLRDQNLRNVLIQKGKKQIEKYQDTDMVIEQWKTFLMH